jgi:hypothetical protein
MRYQRLGGAGRAKKGGAALFRYGERPRGEIKKDPPAFTGRVDMEFNGCETRI